MAPAKKSSRTPVKKSAAKGGKPSPAAAKPASKKKPAAPSASSARRPGLAPAALRPRPGLGRGLDALIGLRGSPSATRPADRPETPPAAPAPAPAAPKAASLPPAAAPFPAAPPVGHILQVKASDIERSPWQPRSTFDGDLLDELADSIRVHGVIQPLLCRRAPDGTCQLIAGERRLRASLVAGLETVPVVMVDADDRDAAEMAVVENIQREDLNVIEEAEGYRTLSERFGLTQQEVSERVGKARASIANALRLLDLPDEVKQMLGAGQLSPGHGKVLLGLSAETDQIQLARRSVVEGLSVRALEKLLERRRGSEPSSARKLSPDLPEAHRKDIEDRLHRHFGAKVNLVSGATFANGRRAHGRLTIDFYDNDDLNRILDLLGVVVE